MRYTKLHTTFWSGRDSRKIAAAGPQGFQVYLYLLSSSMSNYIGLYYLNKHQAMSELRISETDLDAYVAKFQADGFMKYDAENEILWIINAAADNIGEVSAGDKKVVALRKDFKAVDNKSPLREEFYNKYSKMLKLEPETFGAKEPAAPVVPKIDTSKHPELATLFGLLTRMREDQRDVHPVSDDAKVWQRLLQINSLVNKDDIQVLMLNAITTRDLDLEQTLGQAISRADQLEAWRRQEEARQIDDDI